MTGECANPDSLPTVTNVIAEGIQGLEGAAGACVTLPFYAAMFRNYLAAAVRNLLRNRLYTAINVAGLAVGFAVALLIALFIRDELSYDRFFAGSERVYRVYAVGKPPVMGFVESEQTEAGVAQWLPLAFPEIERAASLVKDKRSIRRGDFEVEEEIAWATVDFFDLFRPAVVCRRSGCSAETAGPRRAHAFDGSQVLRPR